MCESTNISVFVHIGAPHIGVYLFIFMYGSRGMGFFTEKQQNGDCDSPRTVSTEPGRRLNGGRRRHVPPAESMLILIFIFPDVWHI